MPAAPSARSRSRPARYEVPGFDALPLEEKELIISYEKDEYAARPRRYYHLARKGRALLREKEEEWTEFTAAVDRVLRGGGCLGSA